MTQSLPSNASLENLRKQAKTLQKKWRAGDAETLARVRALHPRGDQPRLADCQFVLAREAGFDSWPQMKAAVESSRRELAAQFVETACLCYDDPHYDHRSFHARAHAMLASHPEVAKTDIWAASAAGNAAAVARFLDREPALANAPGPHGWAPLICACYSRVQPLRASHSTYEVAKLLLERGAGARAYTLKHNDPPGSDQARRFTALTGVFGGGSTGLPNQPPHPRWRELAELLLVHGADPADEQALWINQPAALDILLRHGLRPDAVVRTPAGGTITLMGRELWQAARRGYLDAARLLVAHGARMDESFDGMTPWRLAMEKGNLELARLLEAAGAPVTGLDPVERFACLCVAGDEAGARAMIADDQEIVTRAPKDLALRAARSGRIAAVRLALGLGFDPDWIDDNAAIHGAAGSGNEAMVRLLWERGASLTLRDPWYDGTAVEWADFSGQIQLRNMLLDEAPICLFDALDHDRLDRVPDILARDPEALNRPFAKCLSREPKPEDWHTPLARMMQRGKTEAVRVLLAHGAAEAD